MSRYSRFLVIVLGLLAALVLVLWSRVAQAETDANWFKWVTIDFNEHEKGAGVLQNSDGLTIKYVLLDRDSGWNLIVFKDPRICSWYQEHEDNHRIHDPDLGCRLYVASQIDYAVNNHEEFSDAFGDWLKANIDITGITIFKSGDSPLPEFVPRDRLADLAEARQASTGAIRLQAETPTSYSLRHNDTVVVVLTEMTVGFQMIQPISPGTYTLSIGGQTREVEIFGNRTMEVTYTVDGFILLPRSGDIDGDGVVNDRDECPEHPDPCPETVAEERVSPVQQAWELIKPEINPLEPGTFAPGIVLGYRYTRGHYSLPEDSVYWSSQDTAVFGFEAAFNRYRFQVAGFGGRDVAMPQRPLFSGIQFQGSLDLTYARVGYGWLMEWQGVIQEGYAYVHDGWYWSIEVSPWSIPERLRWTEILRLGYGRCSARGWLPIHGNGLGWRETDYPLVYLQVNIASQALYDLNR